MARSAGNTREKIIAAAKQFINEHPQGEVSMRKIASLCGISAGTIYNHFPDKDHLMAALMIEDWHKAMARMEASARMAVSFREGVKELHEELCRFIETYQVTWRSYHAAADYADVHNRRHQELVAEIAVYVGILLERFAGLKDRDMDCILAENILNTAARKAIPLETLLKLCAYIAE